MQLFILAIMLVDLIATDSQLNLFFKGGTNMQHSSFCVIWDGYGNSKMISASNNGEPHQCRYNSAQNQRVEMGSQCVTGSFPQTPIEIYARQGSCSGSEFFFRRRSIPGASADLSSTDHVQYNLDSGTCGTATGNIIKLEYTWTSCDATHYGECVDGALQCKDCLTTNDCNQETEYFVDGTCRYSVNERSCEKCNNVSCPAGYDRVGECNAITKGYTCVATTTTTSSTASTTTVTKTTQTSTSSSVTSETTTSMSSTITVSTSTITTQTESSTTSSTSSTITTSTVTDTSSTVTRTTVTSTKGPPVQGGSSGEKKSFTSEPWFYSIIGIFVSFLLALLGYWQRARIAKNAEFVKLYFSPGNTKDNDYDEVYENATPVKNFRRSNSDASIYSTSGGKVLATPSAAGGVAYEIPLDDGGQHTADGTYISVEGPDDFEEAPRALSGASANSFEGFGDTSL